MNKSFQPTQINPNPVGTLKAERLNQSVSPNKLGQSADSMQRKRAKHAIIHSSLPLFFFYLYIAYIHDFQYQMIKWLVNYLPIITSY